MAKLGHMLAFLKERVLQMFFHTAAFQMTTAAERAGAQWGKCMLNFSTMFNKMALTV